MSVPELHGRALAAFGRRVAAVGPDQWHLPTPCEGWDVRELVGHVVAENRWAPPLLGGQTIADVGDRLDGDLLGDDPATAWRESAAEATEAIERPGAMDATAHLSFGDVPGGEYVMQLVADLLIHGWDLARAVGADEHLDPTVVAACAAWFDANEAAYRSAGVIGPAVALPDDADEAARLLARFGRDPSAAES